MKFSIDKSILQNSLLRINRVIPTRSTYPILSCVLFNINKDHLELRATDMEITLSIFVETGSDVSGTIAVPLKTLLDITQEMSEGNLNFEITDIGKIIINTDFGKYSIMGKQADEFPSNPAIEKSEKIVFPAEDFALIIDSTIYAVSKDEMKPALQGVLLQMKDKQYVTVATDGHRLVRYVKAMEEGDNHEGQVIMPAKFLSIIRGHLNDQDKIELQISENHVQISFDSTTVYSRIIKQRFPEYESVIPQDNDKKLVIDKEEFFNSVKRVSIFSNKSTKQISLSLGNNMVTVSTEDPENITAARETIPCEYEGEPLTIGYNAQYLKEVLAHQKGDKVRMKLKTPVSAGIFVPEEGEDDIVTLLMPIRINE